MTQSVTRQPSGLLPTLLCAYIATLFSTIGCGRPATEADCEKIVARVTELELRESKISDPIQIEAQINEAKRSFKDRALKECVGKRLSSKTLDCVAQAKQTKQIVEECF